MNLLAKTFLRSAPWDEFAAECAAKIPHDNPTGHAFEIADGVKKGEYHLLHVVREENSEPVGIVVFDITQGDGKELHIFASYAREPGVDLTMRHLPDLDKIAVKLGCKSIRFHTVRPGLVIKACEYGYRASEVILRKNVSL